MVGQYYGLILLANISGQKYRGGEGEVKRKEGRRLKMKEGRKKGDGRKEEERRKEGREEGR